MKKYVFEAVKEITYGPGAKFITVTVYAPKYSEALHKADELLDISGYYYNLVGVHEMEPS